jgi:hypothetical protein
MPPVAAQKRFQKLKYIGIGQRLSREKWLKIQKRCMNHIRRTSDTWSKDVGSYNIVVEAWRCEICDSCNNLWSRHKLCTIYPLPRLWDFHATLTGTLLEEWQSGKYKDA